MEFALLTSLAVEGLTRTVDKQTKTPNALLQIKYSDEIKRINKRNRREELRKSRLNS